MSDIKLLATDLDGTLIGWANEFSRFSTFRDELNDLRRLHGTLWVACTGRTLGGFRDLVKPLSMMGIVPDYVIVKHAYIYEKTRFGYLPHIIWNLQIRNIIIRSQLYVRRAIDDWHEMITGVSLGVTTIKKNKNRLRLRFDSEDSADVAANLLREKVLIYRHLSVFRYALEVDVRAVPFTKGLAVSELARHLEISANNILAMGNGHNDISMLDGRTAKMIGCPSNSEPEVVKFVSSAGGHLAKQSSLSGALEILQAYRTGEVNSTLPEDWSDPSTLKNPSRIKSGSRHKSHRKNTRTLILLGGMVYTVLLVLADFDIIPIPYVSSIILFPLRILIKGVAIIFTWLS